MKIRITGEKETIDLLTTELSTDPNIKTEEPTTPIDHSELGFGIGEVATIIAIAADLVAVVEYLPKVAAHFKKDEKRIIKFETAIGTVTFELKKGATVEELLEQLQLLLQK